MLKKLTRLLTLVILLFIAPTISASPEQSQQTENLAPSSLPERVLSLIDAKLAAFNSLFTASTWFIFFSTLIIALSVVYYLSSHNKDTGNRKVALIFVILFMVSFTNIVI